MRKRKNESMFQWIAKKTDEIRRGSTDESKDGVCARGTELARIDVRPADAPVLVCQRVYVSCVCVCHQFAVLFE